MNPFSLLIAYFQINILRFYQMKPEHIERMVMTQLSPKSELTDRKPLNQAIHPFIFQDQRQFPFNKIFRDALHHPSPCDYNIKGQFDKDYSKSLLLKKNYVYQRNTQSNIFKSRDKRFRQETHEESPGPSSYNNMIHGFDELNRIRHKRKRKIATQLTNRNHQPTNEKKQQQLSSICLATNKSFQDLSQKQHKPEKPTTKSQKSKNKSLSSLIGKIKTIIPSEASPKNKAKEHSKIFSTKIHRKVFYNKQKIQNAKEQNKIHQKIGPGWYNVESSLRTQKGDGRHQFFQTSSVRFYEQSSPCDERGFYYKDNLWKSQSPIQRKPIKTGIVKKKTIEKESKKQGLNVMMIPNEKKKEIGKRPLIKNRTKMKEQKTIMNEINKYNLYYTIKAEDFEPEHRIAGTEKRKYLRII